MAFSQSFDEAVFSTDTMEVYRIAGHQVGADLPGSSVHARPADDPTYSTRNLTGSGQNRSRGARRMGRTAL